MFKKLKISYRLYSMAIFMFIVLGGISFYVANHTYENLISSRKNKTKNLVETAISIIDSYDKLSKEGEITVAEAKALAAENIQKMRYDGNNYFWIYDLDGNLVMHPFRPSQIGQSMMGTKDKDGKLIYPDFIKEAKNGGGFTDYAGKIPGGDARAQKLAYSEGFNDWNWGVSTGIYIHEVEELYHNKLKEMSVIGIISIVIAFLGLLIISRSITKPLLDISNKMNLIANDNLDIDVGYDNDKTEIGYLADSLKIFRKNAIEKKELEEKERQENALREKRAQNIERLTSSFDKKALELIEFVYSSVNDVKNVSNTVSEIAVKANTQASNVAAASEEATVNVGTVASAATQLSNSIDEISRQVEIASQVSQAAADEAIRTKGIFEKLDESSKKIGEVISLITDIANQTNLLALNATIEAARAGEAGKGFAVVANEVKNLANQTAKATDEISAQIASSQSDTKEAIEAIQSIDSIIKEISEVVSSVMVAVKEQDIATKEIAENISQASSGVREVSSSIVDVSSLVNETGSSSSNVLRSSENLLKNTESLKHEIDTFLSDVKNS